MAVMNPAANLVMVGPMGAGKSCIGRRLAERFDLRFVDVDQVIVAQAGVSISDIFQNAGEAAFRAQEREVLVGLMAGSGQLISTGGGAVLDPDNRRLLAERGFVVYLAVGVQAQLRRLARDRQRPLLLHPDRERLLHELAVARAPLYRQIADLTLNTDHLSPAEATAQLVLQLAAQWQILSTPA